jgi:osmotically-inducible protein OsmY
VGTSLSWQTDGQLVEAVERRLESEPGADWREVAVKASDGVITLTGFVHRAADKLVAEQVAAHVRGVKAVANDIQVMPRDVLTDPEIAKDALHALGYLGTGSLVTLTVRDGFVTLEGRVNSMPERSHAETTVGRLAGVKGVSNAIVVAPEDASSLER